MKQILTNKDEFVGKKMNKIIKIDDDYDKFKLYMFDDAVLIEKGDFYGDYSPIYKYEILRLAVYFEVHTDMLRFDYEDKNSYTSNAHEIYNITSTEIRVTSFGKDLIANNIVTEHELMIYANKKVAEEIERIKIKRQRDIDECIAILNKYGIVVNK